MRLWLVCAVLSIASIASADERPMPMTFHREGPEPPAASSLSPFLVMNRCKGGCLITGGTSDDARVGASTLPCAAPVCGVGSCSCPGGSSGSWTVKEFTNSFGQNSTQGGTCAGDQTTQCTTNTPCTQNGTCTNGHCAGGPNNGLACTGDPNCADYCDTADYEWNQIMQCIKEVYSPFAVTVTDTPPSGGMSYTEDLVAGTPQDIGYTNATGGIAPGFCTPHDNIISFSFANAAFYGMFQHRIYSICWTAAQETAHAFGLEHEYSFLDAYQANNMSACMDPMTYRNDCDDSGEHFFRNADANCGEFAVRPCNCGSSQNSHAKILAVFGPGQSTIAAPTSAVTFPTAGSTISGTSTFVIGAQVGSKRGVSNVELYLNGYKWLAQSGPAFGTAGQPNPAAMQLNAPSGVPNSIIDIQVKAYDDLGAETDSAIVTVTKGAPCQQDTDCSNVAPGQHCASGKCLWDPPTGNLGDACTYDQFCTSGICSPTMDNRVCSQDCSVGVDGACPAGYECEAVSQTDGFCYPKAASSGCCQVGGSPRAVWWHAGLAALVLGFVVRRRRRR